MEPNPVPDLIVGQEIRLRARKMYDAAGRLIVFEGVITALTDLTVDAIIKFNGASLRVAGIPLEIVSSVDAGIGGETVKEER